MNCVTRVKNEKQKLFRSPQHPVDIDTTMITIIAKAAKKYLPHIILTAIGATVAHECNVPDERLGAMFVGFCLPEIYLLQRFVRMFVLKEEGYRCECCEERIRAWLGQTNATETAADNSGTTLSGSRRISTIDSKAGDKFA